MDRVTFDKLPIIEQVDYINNSGMSVTKTCSLIDIPKSTVTDRFKKNNYKFIDGAYRLDSDSSTKENNDINIIDNKEKEIINNQLKYVMNRINELNRELKELKELKEVNDISKNKNIKHFEGIVKVKSFKINDEIGLRLENIYKKYGEYKKQDIINTIIEIGLDNIE